MFDFDIGHWALKTVKILHIRTSDSKYQVYLMLDVRMLCARYKVRDTQNVICYTQ